MASTPPREPACKKESPMTGANAGGLVGPPPLPSPNVLSQMSQDSPSFGFIEYFLRLSLHASTAKVSLAWEVSNPQLTSQFDKRARGVLTVDSWIDIASLPEGVTEEEVLRRGYPVNQPGGAWFSVGKVKLSSSQASRRFILCKISIGRAYNATKEQVENGLALPDGYDSFLIDQEEKEGEEGGFVAKDHQPSTHAYVIRDASQILPTHVITFEWNAEEEHKSRQRVTCENCESKAATLFCKQDTANLCHECDKSLHEVSKLAAKHTRIPLTEAGPQAFSPCRLHPDRLVEYFCPTCSRPVCVQCKMIGHHSGGEAARHRLVTVAEAWRTVSEAANAHDPILEQRRSQIATRLTSIQERATQVKENSRQVLADLEAAFARAKEELNSVTARKLNILRGEQRELARQVSELDQHEAFVKYQQQGSDATQFILDWVHHQRLRNELHAFPFGNNVTSSEVQADIRLHGALHIFSADNNQSANSGDDRSNHIGGLVGGSFERPRYISQRKGASPSIFDLAGPLNPNSTSLAPSALNLTHTVSQTRRQ